MRRRVFTVRASSSANVDGPIFKLETELGLLESWAEEQVLEEVRVRLPY